VLTAILGSDGSVVGFAKVTRDVTERREYDEELAAKHAELARSHREREILLQEVHHRVKNNLQVISSLMSTQSRRLAAGPAKDALDECQTRVLAIALIHQQLYQSKDYSRVRFAEYARTLAASVFRVTRTSSGDVTLEVDIEDIPLGVNRAIPCGLLINELITNSLKHGFKNNARGTVRVELRSVGREIRLTVEDDGAGLPEAFDVYKAESVGMMLVVTLAEQLDARLTVKRGGESAAGASFAVTFSEVE
jgi:two-component sensor histidine kinase